MRCFAFLLLSFTLVVTGCKRRSAEPAAEVATAAPTPAPTPEPTPEPPPVDMKSEVIVLCYHRFEGSKLGYLSIPPEMFEQQLQTLKDNGVEVISMEDFLAWRRGEKSIPKKAAIISIDDGYQSGYDVAWPMLKKFGYPFTMFVYTNFVNAGGKSITWDQLAEMRDAGVEIGSHTLSHSDLNARKGKSDAEYEEWLMKEIGGSKQMIEEKLGIKVRALAYPLGKHNENVRKAAAAAGYDVAFSVYGQRLGHDADAMQLGRYSIEFAKPQIFEQAATFKGSTQGGSAGAAQLASAVMVTQPMDGETITDFTPELKVNLATLGKVDPKSVTMRVSGFGLVPAKYDPESKNLTYKFTEKLRSSPVTVIVGATADGRKVETRWSFNLAAKAE